MIKATTRLRWTYKIVKGTESYDVDAQVTKMLNERWVLAGGMACVSRENVIMYIQPMKKWTREAF